MEKNCIPTDDLFSLTKGFDGKLSFKADNVHYTGPGHEVISVQVAAKIEKLLPTTTAQ